MPLSPRPTRDRYKAEYTLIGEEMRKQIEEASQGGEDA